MFLAIRELKHGKLRFSMIGLITVLIAWLVFILSGLGNDLSTLSAATFKNMNAHYVTFEEGSRASMSRSLLSESLVKELENQTNVTAASAMGATMGTVFKSASADKVKVDVAILGITPGSFLEPSVIEGKPLQADKPLEVIVNDTLKKKGFKIGDTLEIEGSLEKVKIVGFVTNETYNHLPAIFTTLDKWRSIQFAALGSDKGIEKPVNAIMLQGENIDPEKLNKHFKNTETVTKAAAIQGMPGYKEENGTIMMMLAFLLAISAFVIGVFFYVLTLQKSNQFGILKAIGASNRFLGKAIVSQVFLLSSISIVVGILLTYGTALILPDEMPFSLDTKLVVVYALLLLVVSILSSLISVRKITKIDPLQAIGRME
ncbi:Putative hemin transport system permease protein HrtB [Geobacillus thermodenitrificans]|uniref:ABC transporter permease n=1 Tax=Geobacillus thermodenitrificans TaxID=33940 RepID=UPI000A28E3C0|nr:ABC transporter permease [Geobacillus thermodenitrificans]ARP42531.1 Putative hemin transport system permease protein HrtB [Geobacillus thermodenitrificans]